MGRNRVLSKRLIKAMNLLDDISEKVANGQVSDVLIDSSKVAMARIGNGYLPMYEVHRFLFCKEMNYSKQVKDALVLFADHLFKSLTSEKGQEFSSFAAWDAYSKLAYGKNIMMEDDADYSEIGGFEEYVKLRDFFYETVDSAINEYVSNLKSAIKGVLLDIASDYKAENLWYSLDGGAKTNGVGGYLTAKSPRCQ